MDLNRLISTLGSPLTISRVLIFPEGGKVVEYVQGILREVKEDSIVIEQYFTFYDYVLGIEDTPSKLREFKKGEFDIVSVLKH